MSVALVALQAALFPLSGGWARLGGLAVLVGLGMGVYFGVAHLLGGLDLRQAVRMLRRRGATRTV